MKKIIDAITFILGIFLVLVGCAFVLSPFPLGWVFISSGMLLMILVSARAREFAKRRLKRHPRIESKVPQKVKDLLNK